MKFGPRMNGQVLAEDERINADQNKGKAVRILQIRCYL